MVVPFYISTSSGEEFQLPYILADKQHAIRFNFSHSKRRVMVFIVDLICILLITSDIEHFSCDYLTCLYVLW